MLHSAPGGQRDVRIRLRVVSGYVIQADQIPIERPNKNYHCTPQHIHDRNPTSHLNKAGVYALVLPPQ